MPRALPTHSSPPSGLKAYGWPPSSFAYSARTRNGPASSSRTQTS
jgi:hypothetical protein